MSCTITLTQDEVDIAYTAMEKRLVRLEYRLYQKKDQSVKEDIAMVKTIMRKLNGFSK